MRQIRALWRVVWTSLLTVTLLIGALFLLRTYLPALFPVSPSISTTASTTTVITPTISYGDALKTYEVVATSAIRSAERSLTTIQWLVVVLVTAASGVAAFLYNATKKAENMAESAKDAAQEAGKRAEEAEEDAKEAEQAAETVWERFKDLSKKYDQLQREYNRLSKRHDEIAVVFFKFAQKIPLVQGALEAWERGEVSVDKVLEAEQWASWTKWAQDKDETGWQELQEVVDYGDGLVPIVKVIVELELERLVGEEARKSSQTDADRLYEERLRTLLTDRMGRKG